MGRRKKELIHLEHEKINDIYNEIKNDEKILNLNIKEKNINENENINKNENKQDKNKIIMEKISTVEKMIEMYPKLKKDKNKIIDNILQNKIKETNKYKEINYKLQKININGLLCYRDNENNVIDNNLNLIGLYKILSDNIYEYILFDT